MRSLGTELMPDLTENVFNILIIMIIQEEPVGGESPDRGGLQSAARPCWS